jgi:hypothetical protein
MRDKRANRVEPWQLYGFLGCAAGALVLGARSRAIQQRRR